MDYDFPGNIRELENIIERAFILCDESEIGPGYLPPSVGAKSQSTNGPNSREKGNLEQLEAEAIRTALLHHGGNRARAAGELGIHRSTLIRKLKRYGLLSVSS